MALDGMSCPEPERRGWKGPLSRSWELQVKVPKHPTLLILLHLLRWYFLLAVPVQLSQGWETFPRLHGQQRGLGGL